jgi:hypothetical protein
MLKAINANLESGSSILSILSLSFIARSSIPYFASIGFNVGAKHLCP